MNIEDYGWSKGQYWEAPKPIFFLDDIPNAAIGHTQLSLFWHGDLVFRNFRGYVEICLEPNLRMVKKYTGKNYYQKTRDVFIRLLKANHLPNGLEYKFAKKKD
jgi:hypothetical protein